MLFLLIRVTARPRRPRLCIHRSHTRSNPWSLRKTQGDSTSSFADWRQTKSGLIRKDPMVELEGIEPSSVGWLPAALRPFPCLWLMAATLPGELGHKGPPPELSPGSGVFPVSQRSFPAVHYRFWCQAAAVRPRVPLLVAMILYLLTSQAARTRSSVSASLLVPRFGSLSNSGRTSAHPGPNVETDQPLVHVVDCQNAFPHETLREGLPGEDPKRNPAL